MVAPQLAKPMPNAFEDSTNEFWTCVAVYGKGENEGTIQVRVQLLWRDCRFARSLEANILGSRGSRLREI